MIKLSKDTSNGMKPGYLKIINKIHFIKSIFQQPKNWNWEKLTIYNDVFELKQTLNINGLVTSEESITEIDINNVTGIKIIENGRTN